MNKFPNLFARFYPMNTSKHQLLQLNIIYIATTIFLVALSTYTVVQIRNLIDSSLLLTHSYHVKQLLQTILTTTVEAETDKRGFLLTGDSLLLQKKILTTQSLILQQTELDSLIQDNAEQVDNLKQLRRVIREKIAIINDIPVGRAGFQLQYEMRTNTTEGTQAMDSVRKYIEKMMLVETHLLSVRTQRFSQRSSNMPILTITFFLGALLILLVSYLALQVQLRQSQLHRNQFDFQHDEKEKQAAELVIANEELRYQSAEKEKRAEELLVANEELRYQSAEKEKRAAELVIANEELRYQSAEKEKRAAELVIANEELRYQSAEKEKRAEELVTANKELQYQSVEKEKRTVELLIVNRDLQLFTQISSHDLQEPLRKLQMAASRINGNDYDNLSEKGKGFFNSMREAASAMQTLIDDLITYSETNNEERTFVKIDLGATVEEVKIGLKERIDDKNAVIEVVGSCKVSVIPFQFRQLLHNILGNALKFSQPQIPPHIIITGTVIKGVDIKKALHSDSVGKTEMLLPEVSYCHIRIADNGIGFEPEFSEKIFEVFQRLHTKDQYKGTGIGLAIVKKIVENHNGIITASSTRNEGATFDIYLPQQTP
jgi:signal transduction histidine kinase